MDYLLDPGVAGGPTPSVPRAGVGGDGPTINGVVINVGGSASPSGQAGSAKKAVKKVRREASFRQLFHSKSTKARA